MCHLCAVSESKITVSSPTSTSPYLRPPARSYMCRTAPVAVCCVSTSLKARGIVPEQGLEKVAAAVDLDLAAILDLELLDLLCNGLLEQGGIVPGDFIEGARGDVLRSAIEGCRTLVRRVGGLRPGGREHLIGLSAEQERTGLCGPLGHDRGELLIEVGHQPPAVPEAAVAVLVGAAGRLHDAIQRQEGSDNQLSHVRRIFRVTQRLTLRMSATGTHALAWYSIPHAALDAVVRCPREKRADIAQGGEWIQPLNQRRAQANIGGWETATELR